MLDQPLDEIMRRKCKGIFYNTINWAHTKYTEEQECDHTNYTILRLFEYMMTNAVT